MFCEPLRERNRSYRLQDVGGWTKTVDRLSIVCFCIIKGRKLQIEFEKFSAKLLTIPSGGPSDSLETISILSFKDSQHSQDQKPAQCSSVWLLMFARTFINITLMPWESVSCEKRALFLYTYIGGKFAGAITTTFERFGWKRSPPPLPCQQSIFSEISCFPCRSSEREFHFYFTSSWPPRREEHSKVTSAVEGRTPGCWERQNIYEIG